MIYFIYYQNERSLMKFEKLNENKIKIFVSMKDLEDKDISFHDFMSNSIESQDLFLDILEEAEEKIGFKTSNCKIRVEAFVMTDKDFILTITKVVPDSIKKQTNCISKKKPKVRKKVNKIETSTNLIYKFNTFDDYCSYTEYLICNNLTDAWKVAKSIQLYSYNNFYFLVFRNINNNYNKLSTFYTAITEFGSYVLNPNLFLHKLTEFGTLFVKNNALNKAMKIALSSYRFESSTNERKSERQ